MAGHYDKILEKIETAITATNSGLYNLNEWKNGMRRATDAVPAGATITFVDADLEAALRDLRDAIEDAVATIPVEV